MGDESSHLRLDLLKRGLNCHGQQLTNVLAEFNASLLSQVDLRSLDYNIFQSQQKHTALATHDETESKRQYTLHQFIAENSSTIFSKKLDLDNKGTNQVMKEELETVRAEVPPIESFAGTKLIGKDERKKHFFDLVEPDDVLVCRMSNESEAGLRLDVLAFDPVHCRHKGRKLDDLGIKCFCPQDELPPNVSSSFGSSDLLRVVILEVKMQRLLVSMRSVSNLKGKNSSTHDTLENMPLGKIKPSTLYRQFIIKSESSDSFQKVLESSEGFLNPLSVDHLLTRCLGMKRDMHYSLLPSLQTQVRPTESAKALRQRQSSLRAYESVEKGVRFFKDGNFLEAFQCLNTALKIDPINVEALVARGALYANNGSLEKAVDDFKKALSINPRHKNGKKYICETLLALAKENEAQENELEALEAYEDLLKYDHLCSEAMNGVKFLKSKPKRVSIKEAREVLQSALNSNTSSDKTRKRSGETRTRSNSGSNKKGRKSAKKRSRRRDSSSSSNSSESSVISEVTVKQSEVEVIGGDRSRGFSLETALPDMSKPPPHIVHRSKVALPPTLQCNGSTTKVKSGYDKAVEEFLKNVQSRSSHQSQVASEHVNEDRVVEGFGEGKRVRKDRRSSYNDRMRDEDGRLRDDVERQSWKDSVRQCSLEGRRSQGEDKKSRGGDDDGHSKNEGNVSREYEERQSRTYRSQSSSKFDSKSHYELPKSSTSSSLLVPMLPDAFLDEHANQVTKSLRQLKAQRIEDEGMRHVRRSWKRKPLSSQVGDEGRTDTIVRSESSRRRQQSPPAPLFLKEDEKWLNGKDRDKQQGDREVRIIRYREDKDDTREREQASSTSSHFKHSERRGKDSGTLSDISRSSDRSSERVSESHQQLFPNLSLPKPVSSIPSSSSSAPSSSSIMPGAKNFEDLEAILEEAKRRRKDAMMDRNKALIKKNNSDRHWS